MIAKLTSWRRFDHGGGGYSRAESRPYVDNYGASGSSLRRTRRPVPICQWRKAVTGGALECVWHVEGLDGMSASEEPTIRRLIDFWHDGATLLQRPAA